MRRIFIILAFASFFSPAWAEEVVLYSSNNQESIDLVVAGFEAARPGTHVSVVRDGTGALMNRLRAESAAPRADLFWSGGFATLGANKDLFAAYNSPAAAAIDATMIGPDSLWLGTNVHVMVLMVNTDVLDGLPVPSTWADLFDPRYKGKIVITDPAKSSSAYAQVYGVRAAFGEAGMKKLAANVVQTSSTGATYEGVAKGEFPIGVTMEYAAQQYVAGGQKNIKLVYPADGTFLSPEGMVVIRGAPHQAEAKAFYDYLASKPIQAALASKTFRRPARDDVALDSIGLPTLAAVKIFPTDDVKAAVELKAVVDDWNAAVGR
jgi:iron(III) transport system substrate-binding protein